MEQFQELILFGVRLVVAAGVALLTWLLSSPIYRGLHRAAFKQPIQGGTLFPARLVTSIVTAVLAFFLVGFTGLGGLSGGGGLWPFGSGPGGGTSKETGKGAGSSTQTGTGTGTDKPTSKAPREMLRVEMLPSALDKGDDKVYLLHGKEPSVTLADVERELTKYKERYDRVEIVVFLDSPTPKHATVKGLEQRVRELGMTPIIQTPKLRRTEKAPS